MKRRGLVSQGRYYDGMMQGKHFHYVWSVAYAPVQPGRIYTRMMVPNRVVMGLPIQEHEGT